MRWWVAALFLIPFSVQATSLVPLSSDDQIKNADVIFVGTCVGREYKDAANPPHTEYQFQISSPLKGVKGATFTFRQWGGYPGAVPSPGKSVPRILGLPVFVPGTTYLLFLGNESEWGLRSPLGFGQGTFKVSQDASGNSVVQNEFGNQWLFPATSSGTGKSLHSPGPGPGPIRLDDMLDRIRREVKP